MDKQLADLPKKYRPAIEDLKGDMQAMALGLEERFPGMGALITLALSDIFNGQWVYVRRMKGAMTVWRDDSIREQYDQGNVTARELARTWGLSQSSIEKILSKPSQPVKNI